MMLALVSAVLGPTHHSTQNTSAGAFTSEDPVPFDLVENNFSDGSPKRDLNGWMLNPQWSEQQNPGAPLPDASDIVRCPSTDFSDDKCVRADKKNTLVDKAGLCTILNCGLGPLFSKHPGKRAAGHVNWKAATYMGKVCLNDISADFDYTLNIMTFDSAGLTTLNPPNDRDKGFKPLAIHTEFDTRETVLSFITPEWKKLSGEPGDDCDNKPDLCVISNNRAIEVGLMGLDTVHNGYSELHPVYALAIEIEPSEIKSKVITKWLIFARNRGDQGDCSTHDHPLVCNDNNPVEELTLFLPAPARAIVSDATLLPGTAFASNTPSPVGCPIIGRAHYGNDDGVFVRIPLPSGTYGPPADGPLVEGVLRIEWQISGTAASSDWDKLDYLPKCGTELRVKEEEPNIENAELLKTNRYLLKDELRDVPDPEKLTSMTCPVTGQIPQLPITVHVACEKGAVNTKNDHITKFHERLAERNRRLKEFFRKLKKK
jgi:hypothetical protein